MNVSSEKLLERETRAAAFGVKSKELTSREQQNEQDSGLRRCGAPVKSQL